MSEAIITRVNGPVVEVETEAGLAMRELVAVGPQRLPGEVIALEGPGATVQVYEYTGGLRPGDEVIATGGPLAVDLGPGLLGGVFDGILRPLRTAGAWIEPGSTRHTPTQGRAWTFTPSVRSGEQLSEGATLGTIVESPAIDHHLMVPPGVAGRVDWIAAAGELHPGDTVARVGDGELGLTQRWPVRRPRPTRARLAGAGPLVTGQRVLDLLFPIARGSTAAIPGGFGTGKTVALQQIAKWCDASVIVYVGCGERGNELADVLEDFEALEDPRTGRPLLDRTVLIANTSNMPVMAREASIYTGVTVAEYYRDMGYDAVVIADSTSRWAEALRELASRTNELPAEEGYPAGLSSALADFYERAGRVQTLGGATASVSILGAVSPPGGDLTEPVTSHTRRFVRAVWSLDRDLAYARHYPAVSWHDSSARDVDQLAAWQAENGDPGWGERRTRALRLLTDADRIESIAQLVGAESLPGQERITLRTARLLREAVLQQSAVLENDQFSAPAKQRALLALVLEIDDRLSALLERGVSPAELEAADLSGALRARYGTPPDGAAEVEQIGQQLMQALDAIAGSPG
ncbi:MAG TPA: V-type ATP synthase subunit A [Solirubrobacteraceae bacterium]|nr:V-type ATP synthase subunit A [Solirubrobacteraceae bacterium]